MKTVVRDEYGGPEVLKLRQASAPTIGAGEVLIDVMAASLNAADIHLLRGTPLPARLAFGLRRPKRAAMGADVAGRVAAVGSGVSEFQVGDRVFGDLSGAGFGAFAQQVAAPASALTRMPDKVDYAEAAASGMAAVTALQAVRGKRGTQAPESGDHVLVTGASGGVGSFAVQIAKAYGAHVTAVTGTENVEAVLALGADQVIDRRTTDFRAGTGAAYDLIVEAGGYGSVRAVLRLLKRGGRYVFVGGGDGETMTALLLGKSFLATPSQADLREVAQLLQAGSVVPLIGARFGLEQAADAFRLLESGSVTGKIVFDVGASVVQSVGGAARSEVAISSSAA